MRSNARSEEGFVRRSLEAPKTVRTPEADEDALFDNGDRSPVRLGRADEVDPAPRAVARFLGPKGNTDIPVAIAVATHGFTFAKIFSIASSSFIGFPPTNALAIASSGR